ncbi:MAG: hypothetical protein WC358_08960 [Ignavibacteria bacterium]|jgi:hypothetical protein
MKKKIVLFLFLLFFPILIGSYIYITNNNDEPDIYREIKNTAKDGLQDFIKQIPEGYETEYGFSSKYEVINATIGNVYEVYTISPEFLNFPNNDKKSFVRPIGQFRVEVTYNDEVKTYLTVDKVNGNYKVVDLGGAELSKEFSKTVSRVRDNNPRRIIFRLYQLQCDFLATAPNSENIRVGGNEIETFNFYSTFSSRKTFSGINEFARKYSFGEIMPFISDKYSQKFDGGVEK